MVKLSLRFSLEKETKNTYRYAEDKSEVVKFMYIAKKDLGSPAPETITVTIEG